MSTIRLNSVSKTFGGTRALDDITCEIPLGHVHGLIGRNGAGKTTLLRSIAGQVVTDGEITIGGEPVRDNQPVLDRIVLGGADIPYPPQMRVRTLMDIGASRWQNWDDSFATHLVDLFGVNTKARFSELSRGQKTLVGNVIGLAASAEITLLDEPYLGLHVPEPGCAVPGAARRDRRRPGTHLHHLHPPRGGRCPPAGFGDPARPGACHDGAGR